MKCIFKSTSSVTDKLTIDWTYRAPSSSRTESVSVANSCPLVSCAPPPPPPEPGRPSAVRLRLEGVRHLPDRHWVTGGCSFFAARAANRRQEKAGPQFRGRVAGRAPSWRFLSAWLRSFVSRFCVLRGPAGPVGRKVLWVPAQASLAHSCSLPAAQVASVGVSALGLCSVDPLAAPVV